MAWEEFNATFVDQDEPCIDCLQDEIETLKEQIRTLEASNKAFGEAAIQMRKNAEAVIAEKQAEIERQRNAASEWGKRALEAEHELSLIRDGAMNQKKSGSSGAPAQLMSLEVVLADGRNISISANSPFMVADFNGLLN